MIALDPHCHHGLHSFPFAGGAACQTTVENCYGDVNFLFVINIERIETLLTAEMLLRGMMLPKGPMSG